MRRSLISLVLLSALLLLAVLAGCGQGDAPPSESEESAEQKASESLPAFSDPRQIPSTDKLSADLQNGDEFPDSYDIYASSIIKSQTNEDAGTYVAYFQVSAKSEAADIMRKYKLTYTLYDQGWLLETVETFEEDSWSFTPLVGMTDEEVLALLPENSEISSSKMEDGVQNVSYQYREYHTYCTVTYTAEKSFYFEPDGEYWYDVAEPLILDTAEEWDITGRWIVPEDYYYIDINSSDAISGVAELKYNYYSSGWKTESLTAPFRKAQSFIAETGLKPLSTIYDMDFCYVTRTSNEDLSAKKSSVRWPDQFQYIIDLSGAENGTFSHIVRGILTHDRHDDLSLINRDWEKFEEQFGNAVYTKLYVGYDGIAISGGPQETGNRELTLIFQMLRHE